MLATRRNLMAAVAVLPIVACPAPALAGRGSRAIAAGATGDAMWDRLYAAFRAAQLEECKRLAVFAPLDDAWGPGSALREPEPTRPKLTMETEAAAWNAMWAAYEADRAAWKARDDAAYVAHVGDTGDQYEAACDACSDAVDALMAHPVTTLEALAQKAEVMTTRYCDVMDGDDAKNLIADIRRLAGTEAQA